MQLLLWPASRISRFAFLESCGYRRFAVPDFTIRLHDRPCFIAWLVVQPPRRRSRNPRQAGQCPGKFLPPPHDEIAFCAISLDEACAPSGTFRASMVAPNLAKGASTISPRRKQSLSADQSVAAAAIRERRARSGDEDERGDQRARQHQSYALSAEARGRCRGCPTHRDGSIPPWVPSDE